VSGKENLVSEETFLCLLCFLCLFVAHYSTRMQTSVAGNAFSDPRLIHATIV